MAQAGGRMVQFDCTGEPFSPHENAVITQTGRVGFGMILADNKISFQVVNLQMFKPSLTSYLEGGAAIMG